MLHNLTLGVTWAGSSNLDNFVTISGKYGQIPKHYFFLRSHLMKQGLSGIQARLLGLRSSHTGTVVKLHLLPHLCVFGFKNHNMSACRSDKTNFYIEVSLPLGTAIFF